MTTSTPPLSAVCVYCGSATGNSPVYAEQARQLAATLANNNIRLVYGGGNVGLMGIIATEVMRLGGQVTGVIPQQLLDMEVGHTTITEQHVVADMHERKALMAKLSDGFIAMPGGIGTLEELFEMLTWGQLGFHFKPVGLLNVNGFYDTLLAFLAHQVTEGFLRAEHARLLIADNDPQSLVTQLQQFQPLRIKKWWQPFG